METAPPPAVEVTAMELQQAVTAWEVMVTELPPVEEETVKVARSEVMVVVMAQ
jgi:hypothetical protein